MTRPVTFGSWRIAPDHVTRIHEHQTTTEIFTVDGGSIMVPGTADEVEALLWPDRDAERELNTNTIALKPVVEPEETVLEGCVTFADMLAHALQSPHPLWLPYPVAASVADACMAEAGEATLESFRATHGAKAYLTPCYLARVDHLKGRSAHPAHVGWVVPDPELGVADVSMSWQWLSGAPVPV